jgi:hypothetical protein
MPLRTFTGHLKVGLRPGRAAQHRHKTGGNQKGFHDVNLDWLHYRLFLVFGAACAFRRMVYTRSLHREAPQATNERIA